MNDRVDVVMWYSLNNDELYHVKTASFSFGIFVIVISREVLIAGENQGFPSEIHSPKLGFRGTFRVSSRMLCGSLHEKVIEVCDTVMEMSWYLVAKILWQPCDRVHRWPILLLIIMTMSPIDHMICFYLARFRWFTAVPVRVEKYY